MSRVPCPGCAAPCSKSFLNKAMAPTKKIVLRKDSGPSAKKAPKARVPKTIAASATELPIFDMVGKKVGVAALPPKIFSATWRPDLVHQVTTALAANKRQNRAHTKDRAEVAGGGSGKPGSALVAWLVLAVVGGGSEQTRRRQASLSSRTGPVYPEHSLERAIGGRSRRAGGGRGLGGGRLGLCGAA